MYCLRDDCCNPTAVLSASHRQLPCTLRLRKEKGEHRHALLCLQDLQGIAASCDPPAVDCCPLTGTYTQGTCLSSQCAPFDRNKLFNSKLAMGNAASCVSGTGNGRQLLAAAATGKAEEVRSVRASRSGFHVRPRFRSKSLPHFRNA